MPFLRPGREAFLFEQAKTSRAFESVIEQIELAVIQGRLKPGDRLPPERSLLASFQVSRGTLREALRVLEQKGLIEIRIGVKGGAFVRALTTDAVRDSLALLSLTREIGLRYFGEFRGGLSGWWPSGRPAGHPRGRGRLRALAEARVAPRGRSGIRSSRWITAARRGPSAGIRSTSSSCTPCTTNLHSYYHWYLPKKDYNLREACADWREIILAVGRGDAQAAGDLAEDHVRRFLRYMEEGQGPGEAGGLPLAAPARGGAGILAGG